MNPTKLGSRVLMPSVGQAGLLCTRDMLYSLNQHLQS